MQEYLFYLFSPSHWIHPRRSLGYWHLFSFYPFAFQRHGTGEDCCWKALESSCTSLPLPTWIGVASESSWLPIQLANLLKSLYKNISIISFCQDSNRITADLYVCTLPPILEDASKILTLCPAFFNINPAVRPVTPPPTMMTSLQHSFQHLVNPFLKAWKKVASPSSLSWHWSVWSNGLPWCPWVLLSDQLRK